MSAPKQRVSICADVDEMSKRLLRQISIGKDVATLNLPLPLKLKLVKAASLLPGPLQILQLPCLLFHMGQQALQFL